MGLPDIKSSSNPAIFKTPASAFVAKQGFLVWVAAYPPSHFPPFLFGLLATPSNPLIVCCLHSPNPLVGTGLFQGQLGLRDFWTVLDFFWTVQQVEKQLIVTKSPKVQSFLLIVYRGYCKKRKKENNIICPLFSKLDFRFFEPRFLCTPFRTHHCLR